MNELTTYKSAVARRRDMLNVPQVMAALDPHERGVFIASTKETFSEVEPKELSNALASVLRFIFKDTGYRYPGDDEFGYLVLRTREILKRYYGGLTMSDFKLAFEMSITGQLDDYLPKGRDGQADRGHYQQFNAEYICKILNAYKSKRAWILRKAYDALPEPEQKVDNEQAKFYRNAKIKGLLEAYTYYCGNDRLPDITPISEMLYYDALSSVGLATAINVTEEEQLQILHRTLNEYGRRGLVGDMRRLEREGKDAAELQFSAFSLSRRKALIHTFERLRANNVDLRDYIKFEQ